MMIAVNATPSTTVTTTAERERGTGMDIKTMEVEGGTVMQMVKTGWMTGAERTKWDRGM